MRDKNKHHEYLEERVDLSTLKLVTSACVHSVKTESELISLLKAFKDKKRKYRVIGAGSNIVLGRKLDFDLIKLNFSQEENELKEYRESYLLPASTLIGEMTAHALKFGVKGWEIFTGIPGTLGGSVFMNAGTRLGEIGDLIEEVHIVSGAGEKRIIKTESSSFSYRKNNFLKDGDIITFIRIKSLGVDNNIKDAIKKYLSYRAETQPQKVKTCGCMFKNPSGKLGAGKCLDLIGLKGFSYRGLKISTVHGNFLIHDSGKADIEDVKAMVSFIQDEVYLQLGIQLETEVEFVE